MHYYTFNIGDYHSHTARLSLMEDLAYRRMLDHYYLHERPFNECSTDVAREIGMQEYQAEVDYVLSKFFILLDGQWVQKRCDREVESYQNKRRSASRAGKASAKARAAKGSEQTLNDRSTDVQPTNNHKPITNNQEPVNNGANATRFRPPTVSEVRAYCDEKGYRIDPERFVNFYESKGWMVGKSKMKKWKAALSNWEKRNSEESKRVDNKQSRSDALKRETFFGDF